MDSLAGVRGEKLTTPAAFKKLLKEGQINKGAMRFGSGKVWDSVCGVCCVCVVCYYCSSDRTFGVGAAALLQYLILF
jgi:hypothetical protein